MYNNGTVSNETAVNYTYGDANWGDLLTGYDGEGISYDANGNPLSYYNGKRYTFSWLYGRRLASIVADGKTTTYTYNTEGLRLTKTASGVVHTYYWDGSTLLMEKWGNSYLRFLYDESGAPLRLEYYNGSTTTVYYYVLNLQGDVLEIRDTSNNVVCRYSYDAWGKLLSVKDGSGNPIALVTHIGILNPLRYRGYYYDTETGLYYLQSRYYDPQVGRFISPDTYISTGQGILGYNMYAYCGNNPVNRIDPKGNSWIDLIKEQISFIWKTIRNTITTIVESLLQMQKPATPTLEQQKYAATVYAEAAGQNIKTKRAVAHVINNRIGTRIGWNNAEDVISAPGQFSGYNNAMYNDAMEYYASGKWGNAIEHNAMDECMTVVIKIYNGEEDITGGALYFHSYEKPEMWKYHSYYTQIYIDGTEGFFFYK